MWFKIAELLQCTPREAQERVSSRDFAEYTAFDRISPIGGERLDLLAAHICMHLRAAMYQGRERKSFKVADYLPKWWVPAKKRLTQSQLHRKLIGGFMAHNLRFARRGDS